MAEFVQTMKDWRRMCITANDGSDTIKCYNCPMGESRLCTFEISDMGDHELQEAETFITAWAAEHPEPVYPTWWTYMCMIGVIPEMLGDKTLGEVTIESLMHTHIPDDIAQKLGVEPKEG